MLPTPKICIVLCLFLTTLLFQRTTVAIAQGDADTPVYLPVQENLFPRSQQPAAELNVFNARRLPRHTQAFAASIQGIVNRSQPSLYLELSGNRIAPLNDNDDTRRRRDVIDQVWLDWLVQHQYVEKTTTIDSVEKLLETYSIKDVVVVDPDLPAGLNIATMVAADLGVPLAYPEDVEQYQLNVADDLRGRFKTNVQAYQWAWENLWPRMNHSAIAILSPRIHGHLRDYLVGQKIYTFWISHEDYEDSATTKEDLDFFKKMLKQMPVNIPVMGYPNSGGPDTGIGEGKGVKLLSDHGKFLVPTDWHTNLSVWSGWRSKQQKYQQPELRNIDWDSSKRYISIVVSDGDNMNLWLDFLPTRKYWRSPLRGEIPIGWTMGIAMTQLHAPLLDYYMPSMTQQDSFGCALSGLGYMYPEHFGEAYGQHKNEILRRHFQLTNQFTTKLDMNWFWGTIIGPRGGKEYQTIVQQYSGLQCILEGYGRQWWRDKPYLQDGVPVFHFLNNAVEVDQTQQEVERNLQKLNPQFGVIFIQNWPFDMEKIQAMQESLSAKDPNIIWVRPDEMAQLYRESLNEKSE